LAVKNSDKPETLDGVIDSLMCEKVWLPDHLLPCFVHLAFILV